jgi:hypothetical protein
MTIDKSIREGLTPGELFKIEGGGEEDLYESFDHQYFELEIKNLLDLKERVQQERFCHRRSGAR